MPQVCIYLPTSTTVIIHVAIWGVCNAIFYTEFWLIKLFCNICTLHIARFDYTTFCDKMCFTVLSGFYGF